MQWQSIIRLAQKEARLTRPTTYTEPGSAWPSAMSAAPCTMPWPAATRTFSWIRTKRRATRRSGAWSTPPLDSDTAFDLMPADFSRHPEAVSHFVDVFRAVQLLLTGPWNALPKARWSPDRRRV